MAIASPTILLGGGGTGGHTTAAQVIGRIARAKGVESAWVVRPQSFEAASATEADIEQVPVQIVRPELRSSFSFLRSIYEVFKFLRAAKPRLVVVTGGWVGLPVGIAAIIRRSQLVVHEQTIIPGRTSKALARFAQETWVTFDESKQYFAKKTRAVHVAFPLRDELNLAISQADALTTLGLDPGLRTIFVAGGGSGAESLNAFVERNLEVLLRHYQVVHQVGEAPGLTTDLHRLETARASLASDLRARYFLAGRFTARDVNLALRGCSLAFARAGAAFCNELWQLGVPAVLVPYPYARFGEQDALAEWLSREGIAVSLPDSQLNPSLDHRTLQLLEQCSSAFPSVQGRRVRATQDIGDRLDDLLIDKELNK